MEIKDKIIDKNIEKIMEIHLKCLKSFDGLPQLHTPDLFVGAQSLAAAILDQGLLICDDKKYWPSWNESFIIFN